MHAMPFPVLRVLGHVMGRRPRPRSVPETCRRPERRRRLSSRLAAIAVTVAAVGLVGAPPGADAQEQDEADARWDSESCLACHDGDTSTLTLPSGEPLELGVDGDSFRSSAHTATGVQCAHCHTAVARYPHPELTAPNARSYVVELSKGCNLCHWKEAVVEPDRAHALVPLEVRDAAPVCADCHDPHATATLALDHAEMQARCRACHAEPPTSALEAIHAVDPLQTQEASAPPLILFYVLIVGAVLLVVGLGWAGVLGVQWLRRRLVRSR